MGCCVCIGESEVGIVESFGRFSKIALPGYTCLNPVTDSVVTKLSLRVESEYLDIETRTKDNVFITIKLTVLMKIAKNEKDFPTVKKFKKKKKSKRTDDDENPVEEEEMDVLDVDFTYESEIGEKTIYNAYYRLEEPKNQILAHIEEYFRFHSMEYTLDDMFAAKTDLTHELQYQINLKMNPYGYVICNILMTDIIPNDEIKKSMNDIVMCEKEKRAQQARAEAEKITRILGAEAEARTRELSGEGMAKARKAIINGLKESVGEFQEAISDTDSNSILVTVLMTQYMDTLKEAAANHHNTFIFPYSSSTQGSVEEEMRMSLLTCNALRENQ